MFEEKTKHNNCVFSRSRPPFNGFSKFRKLLNRKTMENDLKIESVLLSALLPSYLVIFLTNFWNLCFFVSFFKERVFSHTKVKTASREMIETSFGTIFVNSKILQKNDVIERHCCAGNIAKIEQFQHLKVEHGFDRSQNFLTKIPHSCET